MPCYEVRVMNLAFSTKNIDILEKAIQKVSPNGNFTRMNNGELVFSDGSTKYIVDPANSKISIISFSGPPRVELVDRLKREYSRQVLFNKAKKNGWAVRKKGKRQYELVKY